MIFVASPIFSQKPQQNLPVITYATHFVNVVPATLLGKTAPEKPVVSAPFLSANYYASKLGFFCKQELKFEKVVKIPFKFRLGGVDDCDKLEGKLKWRN